jgi:hypothetical protein
LQAVGILVGERVVGAETGVVDQSGGVDAAGFELGAQRAAGVGRAEVAPRLASWRANSAPMPELAPVTMTVWRW